MIHPNECHVEHPDWTYAGRCTCACRCAKGYARPCGCCPTSCTTCAHVTRTEPVMPRCWEGDDA